MSEPENFLSRWSRRKLEAEQEPDPSARSLDQQSSALPGSGDPGSHDETAERAALDSRWSLSSGEPKARPGDGNERPTQSAEDAAGGKEPAFDLSTLPSLESITAETDIRVFMQKGVPAELTRAALRRAWAADPTIRDFIEMAENQWDFVTGSDLPGFGPLESSPEELRRMVADLFGEGPKATSEVETGTAIADSGQGMLETPQIPTADESPQQAERQEVATVSQVQSAEETRPVGSSASIVHSNREDFASQQNSSDEEYKALPTRRSHGRALPQ